MVPRPRIAGSDGMRQWIEHLVRDRVSENVELDFKREVQIDDPNARQELAKDAAAMANTIGGAIIIGIDEHKDGGESRAGSLVPVPKAREVASRLRDALVDLIKPPLVEMDVEAVSVPAGDVVVVWVGQSVVGPHQVKGRYYKRVGDRRVEMEEFEIRTAYLASAALEDSARQFAQSPEARYGKDLVVGATYCTGIVAVPTVRVTVLEESLDGLVREISGVSQRCGLSRGSFKSSRYGFRTIPTTEDDAFVELHKTGAFVAWKRSEVEALRSGAGEGTQHVLAWLSELNAFVKPAMQVTATWAKAIAYEGPWWMRLTVEPARDDAPTLHWPPRDLTWNFVPLVTHDGSVLVELEVDGANFWESPEGVATRLMRGVARHFGRPHDVQVS